MTGMERRTRRYVWRRSIGRPYWLGSRTDVRRQDVGRDGALVTPALLRLLPGVGQDADAATEHEEPARQRGGEPEFAVDDRCGAVDVHRYRTPAGPLQRCLDGPGGRRVTAIHRAIDNRLVN